MSPCCDVTAYRLRPLRLDLDGRRPPLAARGPAGGRGALAVNSSTSVRVNTPFGGFKQSGAGRELGPHAADAYTELKNVLIAT